MKKLWMLIAFSGVLPLMAVNVYMAGDSTMARYPASYQYQKGWGQVLQEYAVDGVKVFNMAVGGRSSKSFRSEGRWAKICDALQPGDFVFIQFGHNDGQPGEKNLYRFADPEKSYPENLRQFIREVRAKKPLRYCVHPSFGAYSKTASSHSRFDLKSTAKLHAGWRQRKKLTSSTSTLWRKLKSINSAWRTPVNFICI